MIFGAPAANRLESGSTWSRSPAGYSAWYESLTEQGVDIQRWQRPVADLLEQLGMVRRQYDYNADSTERQIPRHHGGGASWILGYVKCFQHPALGA
jgi:hypothetical protein